MKEKTPQEKKALSYAKDRRNTYGENDKASRKLIPLRKARVNRVYRKRVNEVLTQITDGESQDAEVLEGIVRTIRRQEWKKTADEPLGAIVQQNLGRREDHAGNGKTAHKKTTEFVKNLKIETEQESDGRWIAEAIGLNGVMTYGETEESAINRCRILAQAVYMEKLGACEILSISDDSISTLSK